MFQSSPGLPEILARPPMPGSAQLPDHGPSGIKIIAPKS